MNNEGLLDKEVEEYTARSLNEQRNGAGMQKKRVAIYMRVSTQKQTIKMQESELRKYVLQRGWALKTMYRDVGYSGATTARPELRQMMQDARRGVFDVVVVWRFDRFARSLRHLVDALDFFQQHNIEFISYCENVDTTGASGKLVFQVISAMAEFERTLIGERVRAGIEAARSRNQRIGRPPVARVLTDEEMSNVRKRYRAKKGSLRSLAREFCTTVFMIHKAVKGSV
jgi:DNA invertase Pin-like site-specific DNA recombinase